MQFCQFALVFLAALAGRTAADDHPIGKVITLLQKLTEQVKSEGQAEEVSYQKFVYWCKTSSVELEDAITEEKELIDTLSSTIEGKTKEIELLKEDITKLENEILTLTNADTEAGKDATARNTLYLQKETDLKATITSVGEAVTALEAAGTSTDSALFLSQHKLAQNRIRNIFALIATVATEGEQHSLMNFVQGDSMVQATTTRDPLKSLGDSMAHVKKYNFKSDNVVELLKGLKLKFEDELVAATKEETNAANAHALSKKARDATTTAATNSKTQKETDLSDAEGALTTAQASLTNTQDDLKADAAGLDTTKDSCSMKKSEWEERTSIRTHELEAMEASIKILAKVSGVKTEAPGNPVPPPSPVTFMQMLKFVEAASADPQTKAVQLLRATAKTYHSKALERLAMQVASHVPNQFQDVINSIQKMIFRLKTEQTDEDNHKAWCDMEISKTDTSLDSKKDKIDELAAKIKEDNAKVVTLVSDIEAATKMVADIKTFQEEATDIRQTGKQENALAIKDAVGAQKAITNAISVLQTFYKSSGEVAKEPWEFLQAPVELGKSPSTWDSGYSAVSDPKEAGKGVIAVLEACSSDFAQMEANTRAQEMADQKAYEEDMKTNSIELARRSKESDMKGEEKKRLVSRVTDLTSQKKHVTDERESTEQYEKDLQGACVDGDSTYEDRKAARDAEIQSLADAQGILDKAFDAKPTTTVAFLQKIQRH